MKEKVGERETAGKEKEQQTVRNLGLFEVPDTRYSCAMRLSLGDKTWCFNVVGSNEKFRFEFR